MDKVEIINQLKNCIYLVSNTENVYLLNELEDVKNKLINEWDKEDIYMQEIKNVLGYDETMNNLNNLL